MEGRSRSISIAVAGFGIAVAVLLTRISFRGDVVPAHAAGRQLPADRDARLAAVASTDGDTLRRQVQLAPAVDGGDAEVAPGPPAFHSRVEVLAWLRRPIIRSELDRHRTIETAFDAVARLRPDWLDMPHGVAVHAGPLNVGGIDALHAIRADVVREIRLRFTGEEPHWIVTVDLR